MRWVEAFAGFAEFFPKGLAAKAGFGGEREKVFDAEFLAQSVERFLQLRANAIALSDYDKERTINVAKPRN